MNRPISEPERNLPLLSLTGPTAVGKSEIALRLAEKLDGEIVTVDSMQVFRGLDLGTAKPTLQERARVPHHLLDVVGPDEPFDAARFVALAHVAIADIQSRGRRPILCGGTGLYFKALFYGLGRAPACNPALRAELEQVPLPQLLEELAQRDPVTFKNIDQHNPRRVIRAIEVIRLTGQPYSSQRASWSIPDPALAPSIPFLFGLNRPPAELHRRIDARVDVMFAQGLVAETRALLERGLANNRTALQALGYRQVLEHLRGERSLEETIALVKQRTRQFAKRQLTWLRHQLPVHWIMWENGQTPEEITCAIEHAMHADPR